jgi:hypothetical protein
MYFVQSCHVWVNDQWDVWSRVIWMLVCLLLVFLAICPIWSLLKCNIAVFTLFKQPKCSVESHTCTHTHTHACDVCVVCAHMHAVVTQRNSSLALWVSIQVHGSVCLNIDTRKTSLFPSIYVVWSVVHVLDDVGPQLNAVFSVCGWCYIFQSAYFN